MEKKDFVKYPSFGLIILIFLLGCGGGSKSGGGGDCCGVPGINVEVVSPTGAAAIDGNPNQTLTITVKVTHDSSNAGVTWTLAPAIKGGPTGILSAQQALSVTFNPPTGVTSPVQVTVTATSVTDTTRSATIPITIYPPLVAVTTSSDLTTAFLNTNYTCILQPIGLQLGPGADQFSTEIIGTPTATGVYPFSLTATDATGNTAPVSLDINVAPVQLKVVTPTLMAPIPSIPYSPVQLQASGGVPPYTWSLATGSGPLPPGMSLSSSGAISGTPPADFSSSYSFALQVADSQTPVPAQAVFPAPVPPANGPKIITLGIGDDEALHPCQSVNTSVQANTPYAFVFTGFDVNGPVTFSGSLTSDPSGNLTGIEDIVRSSGAQLAQPLTAGSAILFSDLGRGCLTLSTSGSTAQFRVAPTTLTTAFMDGRILEFDDATR